MEFQQDVVYQEHYPNLKNSSRLFKVVFFFSYLFNFLPFLFAFIGFLLGALKRHGNIFREASDGKIDLLRTLICIEVNMLMYILSTMALNCSRLHLVPIMITVLVQEGEVLWSTMKTNKEFYHLPMPLRIAAEVNLDPRKGGNIRLLV